jgi:proline iminopeptidase
VEQDSSIPHIEIGNTVFHAETYGSDTNDVIIVIHGGPGNDYRNLLDLKILSDQYFVVFYDQRGTGLSPRVSSEELSLETMLTDLNNIVDYYSEGRKAILIGHSWGGMLASGYIAKHPEKVKKAVLAEPGMLTSEKAKEFREKFQIQFSLKLAYLLVKTWFQQMHIQAPDKQAGGDFFFAQIGLAELKGNPMAGYFCNEDIKTASLDFWRYSWRSSQEIMKKGMDEEGNLVIDLVTGLDRFDSKVLFISGECNSIIGPEYQEDQMKYFPQAELVVISDAGHTMIGEKPVECLKVIRQYLDE